MSQSKNTDQPPATGAGGGTDQPPYPPSTPASAAQNQLAYQHHYHQKQQQQEEEQQKQLQGFWTKQVEEIESATDFKNHTLPLARIKKIMKADEEVRMISAEAPVIFAKACEILILELTLRSWLHTEENKRRTLQKSDIAAAVSRTDVFDFLVDIIPRDEMKEEGLGVTKATIPVLGAPLAEYYYPPPPPELPARATVAFVPWAQMQQRQNQQGQTDN